MWTRPWLCRHKTISPANAFDPTDPKERQMKADDVLAIRCKLVEQAPAHCRGPSRVVMVGGRYPIRMRERDCGMG